MSILYRYKKLGEEGFKKLVCKLERTLPRKRFSIIESLWLEDPVYTQYLEPNFLTLDEIFARDGENLKELKDEAPGARDILFFAFFASKFEDKFLNIFPSEWRNNEYEDLRYAYKETPIPIHRRNQAFIDLFENFRKLQETYIIPTSEWKLPPQTVMNGKHLIYPSNGQFKLEYEPGVTALEGEIQGKLRSGKWYHYYPNGRLIAKGIYHLGEKEDHWMLFDIDGNLRSQGNYLEGNKDGRWEMKDGDGIEHFEEYVKGKVA
ncbi:MAG: toxin-antitoxin system YwqK family antitoxin [Bacteriovoracaceae bacterium]